MILCFLESIGHHTLTIFQLIGKFTLFFWDVIRKIFIRPVYLKIICQQIINIGYFSIPVVAMTALFSGAVLALQSYNGFSRFSAEQSIATVVVLSITRELGPVLAGLMVAARVGASTAAEIGTMRVTEQIDALITLGSDPVKYLIVPRVIASLISLPLLVLIADVIGVLGGYLVAVYKLGFGGTYYLINTFTFLKSSDVISGLIKATVFGAIISVVSSYSGFFTNKGAKGVGIATMLAVVRSSIGILIANYLLTALLFV